MYAKLCHGLELDRFHFWGCHVGHNVANCLTLLLQVRQQLFNPGTMALGWPYHSLHRHTIHTVDHVINAETKIEKRSKCKKVWAFID